MEYVSQQVSLVSWTLLSILTDTNNAVVCIVSILLFFLLTLVQNFLLELGDPLLSQNPREFYASHSQRRVMLCAYNICLYVQILISCKVPSGSLLPPSHVLLFTPLRDVHTCGNWWYFTGVWVTSSLLQSPGLSSVFRPFSIMLSFG